MVRFHRRYRTDRRPSDSHSSTSQVTWPWQPGPAGQLGGARVGGGGGVGEQWRGEQDCQVWSRDWGIVRGSRDRPRLVSRPILSEVSDRISQAVPGTWKYPSSGKARLFYQPMAKSDLRGSGGKETNKNIFEKILERSGKELKPFSIQFKSPIFVQANNISLYNKIRDQAELFPIFYSSPWRHFRLLLGRFKNCWCEFVFAVDEYFDERETKSTFEHFSGWTESKALIRHFVSVFWVFVDFSSWREYLWKSDPRVVHHALSQVTH